MTHAQYAVLWEDMVVGFGVLGLSLATRHPRQRAWVPAVEMVWQEEKHTYTCAHPHLGKSTTSWDLARVIP